MFNNMVYMHELPSGASNGSTSPSIPFYGYTTHAILSLINRPNARKSSTYPRRLHSCVASGQQLDFVHLHF